MDGAGKDRKELTMEENTENIKGKALSGFAWRFSERLLTQGVSFLISVVLARLLMPEQYGVIAIVTIFISLADVFVVNGLGTALIQKKEADELDFNTIFYAGIGLSVILYAVVYFSAPLIAFIYKNEMITPVLRVMGLRIPVAAFNSVQQAVVSRRMDFKKFFLATSLGTLLSGVLGIILAYAGAGVWALVAQNMSGTVFNTIILFIVVGWRPKWAFSFLRLKGLFSFGSKVMLTNFIGTLFNQIKGLIIGVRYTTTDLAYYNRGEKIPMLISTNVESTIDSVLFPVLSKIQEDKERTRNTCRRFLDVGSYIIMPLMVGLAVTSENVIRVLLTDKWLPSLPFMQLVCLQQAFSILNTANIQVIKAQGEGNALLQLEFFKKPIYVVILLITMQFSPYAMAVGALGYELVAAAINSRPTGRLIGYTIGQQIKDILPNLLLSGGMALCVWLVGMLPLSRVLVLVLQVAVGAGMYIGLSALFRVSGYEYILNTVKKMLKKK